MGVYGRTVFVQSADTCLTAGTESSWNLPEYTESSGDTSSLQAASTIRDWIHECQQTHHDCTKNEQPQSTPDRILELGNDVVILRKSQDLIRPLQYACLSHCWGPKGPSFRLTSSTAEALMSGVPITRLPQTFQDAVKVCQRINICYLWIDALCK
jgi:hypothetical protein